MPTGQDLPWCLSLWRWLRGWHRASCQCPRAGGVQGAPQPLEPVSWGPGALGLINLIVISARVLMGVIDGGESTRSGSGLCCTTMTL